MLTVIIPENEFYDSNQNKFIIVPSSTVVLEHSLISLAKWEAKWHIPFLGKQKRTLEQESDYIRCMLVTPIKDENNFITYLSPENVQQIKQYIEAPMTATTFGKIQTRTLSKEIITAEIIYYRMFDHNIPIDCQKWHLNRLLTLLRVCDMKASPTKTNKRDNAMRQAELNAMRRAKYNTRG